MIHVLVSTYVQAPDVVEQTRPAHLKFLAAEIEAGRLLLAGRQEDGSGGVLITADMAEEEADALLPTSRRAWRATIGARSTACTALQGFRVKLTARTGNDGRRIGR